MAANDLLAAFGLPPGPHLVAVVGGGGKSSLMFALARAWPGRAVVTTTTRIFAAQRNLAPAVVQIREGDEAGEALIARLRPPLDEFGQCLVVGPVGEGSNVEKALGVPVELPGKLLGRAGIDLVVVEADGSRMRPIKAPADHEPVVPAETTLLAPVAGIDALDGPLQEVAHRPERVRALLADAEPGAVVDGRLTAVGLAHLLAHPQGGLKGAPECAQIVPLINKVETAEQHTAARQAAYQILRQARIRQVVIGAVRTAQPVRAVVRRVTAVILAAGEGARMGRTKQLLPWGDTTLLGQVIRTARATAVTQVLVVSGHEAAAVAAVAQAEGVAVVHNPDYAAGEMLSSLQTAVRTLPAHVGAVLVLLADQPLVTPEVIDRLLAAYEQETYGLIAPTYEGQRGNPVLIDRRYFAELLALPAGAAPRYLLRRHPEDVRLLPVDAPGVVIDLDDPQAYERWKGRPG
ncbi:MAG: putative selenium-dependent hydroxylase accessory protein YqeC [Ardenticatenaceae bacterium]|nr:putative selenium-dependent hydroxylase accessory protein YqeC [Ardenticatenaceae bacterium]